MLMVTKAVELAPAVSEFGPAAAIYEISTLEPTSFIASRDQRKSAGKRPWNLLARVRKSAPAIPSFI